MSNLSDAFEVLKFAHARFDLSGRFSAGKRAGNIWPVDLPTSIELNAFFNECEPEDVKVETGLIPLKLAGLETLNKAQVGYRWFNTASGLILNPAWPKGYVVIMDDSGGGKPIVAMTEEVGTPIYAGYDTLAPFMISDSIADFLLALAKLIEIVYGEYNIFDVFDDDGVVDSFMQRLEKDVEPILGADNFNRFVDYFYG
ncbi:hypothetical protein [Pseudomonas sichuanensis]|uniref:hypothetical protein n=1 Tax=Pseudomonas TaxID=286 RepID=UPI0036E6C781